MLTIPHCKESLSRAYITAVVGRARHKLEWAGEFDYGVDGSVRELKSRGQRICQTGFGFDFQSKSTVEWNQDVSEIVYDLDADNYNDLVGRAGSNVYPFFLILLCLPCDDNVWLNVSADELILRRCAFWCKLNGAPTDNSAKKRIRIPVTNLFTPDAVVRLLQDIRSGALLP